MNSGSTIHRTHSKCTLSPIQVCHVDSVKVRGFPFVKEHGMHTTKKVLSFKKKFLSKYVKDVTVRLDFT